jgi:phage protein U
LSSSSSYQKYLAVPSAIVSDGIVTVPLWAVTTITLSETYHLPPIGSSGAKAIVATHDDTVSLSGVLVGPERHAWKLALENLADASKRGSALAAATGGRASGLILVTSMTIRTDMQVQSLSFGASAAKRDALDVSITLTHMPLPGTLGRLLDVASLGVAALVDWKAA